MVHILGVQLFENNFVKVTPAPYILSLIHLLIASFLPACLDPFLRDKSPHGRPYLRSPPNIRHLPRSSSLRDASDSHRSLPLLSLHLSHSPTRAPGIPHLQTGAPIDAPPKSGRRTRLPCATRRATPAPPKGQNKGHGPSALATDRVRLEARDAGEYCTPANDRESRWQEARDGSPCARTAHAVECKDGEEAQQSGAA